MTVRLSRREFVAASSAAGVVSVAGLGGLAYAQDKPAPVTLGIIGCGSIMQHHLRGLVSRKENVSIAWLCDVDPAQIDKSAKLLEGFQSAAPKSTQRYEEVLDDRNVDAVIVATPHHWHAPMALAAMQAGKDVYLEKPLSHVFDEGPMIIEAAQRSGRIVQQGSQMRNSPVTKKAGELLASGVIGEIKVARAWTAEIRKTVKPVADTAPPAGVDYDRWLGPAPRREFNPLRWHQTWRMFRDYANGEIGDDGIHDIDMAAWGLSIDSLPTQVTARGSRMMLHGHAGDYPDNMHVAWEFPDGRVMIYENYPFTSYGLFGFDNGNVFYGTEGYMVFSRRGAFSVFLGPKNEPGPTEGKDLRGQRGYAEHMAEFLTAVRQRTPVSADPQTAHLSCALVHLGEATYRTRGQLNFDPDTSQFVDCDEANALLTKEYREPYGLPG
jgi:predicted dehydrogenase